jgi:EAL domain-containing protein (putative c-di-GMP-specific phosphodiesterase class I)
MADPSRTMTVLRLLADLGVALSIDDFGTGYSSLSYLKRVDAHELKIDKSFVMGMSHNSNDAVIVRSTIELGHNLGLRMVAEGVEDAKTWRLLRALGCDVVQGYHLSRPLPPEKATQWLLLHGLRVTIEAEEPEEIVA